MRNRVRSRRAVLAPLGVLALACAAQPAAAVSTTATDNGVWLNAITSGFVLLDMVTGDLDGDGRDDSALCLRRDLGKTDEGSQIAILTGKAPDLTPAFFVELEGALCEKVRINGNKLGILLAGKKQLVWTYGEEIGFRGSKRDPLAGADAHASTSTDRNAPKLAFDGNVQTSWAEGKDGTGLGEHVDVKLKSATDVAWAAVFCGRGDGQRAFLDHNRIHRGSVEAKTEADVGDASAGVDFSALGIDTIGDRVDFNCENRPGISWVRVGRRGVVEVQVRIDSVYLGDKKDETHIAEVLLVPSLSMNQTLDRARDLKTKASAAEAARKEVLDAEQKAREDEGLKKLDEGGRSVVPDDF